MNRDIAWGIVLGGIGVFLFLRWRECSRGFVGFRLPAGSPGCSCAAEPGTTADPSESV